MFTIGVVLSNEIWLYYLCNLRRDTLFERGSNGRIRYPENLKLITLSILIPELIVISIPDQLKRIADYMFIKSCEE